MMTMMTLVMMMMMTFTQWESIALRCYTDLGATRVRISSGG
jgi:hypothetical protein